ncbi:MAG TPA: YncE family protein [Terriglobales bacterium]|nr:YncE family protein [Terriglobales bacterium]
MPPPRLLPLLLALLLPPLPLRLLRDVPLPGRATRFDYESLDPQTGVLFIAHLGDGHVLAFDTRAGKLVADIPGVAGVHGVLAVPSLGRVYASATGTNQVVAIDERTFRIVATMPGGVYPDGLAFDPADHELFVSDERGATDTVIDTTTNRRIATIPLGGEAGNTQYDPVSGRMFVAVQTRNALVAINPKTRQIVASYPLPGCDEDHGVYLDVPHRLAFIACQDNATLLTFDLRSLKVTQTFAIGRDPDVLAFDSALRRLYVASESGVVSVFDEKDRALIRRGQAYLAREAHSVAVDAQHRVYFPLQDIAGRPLLRILAPTN